MTTVQEKTSISPEKKEENPVKETTKKPSAKKRSARKKKPQQRSYDHLPIIIGLLVIFSFTLFCIGIGLTRYLGSERAGIPACDKAPCSSPFVEVSSQKGEGE